MRRMFSENQIKEIVKQGIESGEIPISIPSELVKYEFKGEVGQGYAFELTENEWKSIKGIPYFMTIRVHINDNPDDDERAYVKFIGGVVCEHSDMPGLDGYTLFSSTIADNMILFTEQDYIGLPVTLQIYCLKNPDITPVELNNLFQIEL